MAEECRVLQNYASIGKNPVDVANGLVDEFLNEIDELLSEDE